VRPNVVRDLTRILPILEFVRRGQGISVLASLVLPREYRGLVYRRITPTSRRRVGLACLNERTLSPAARAFWMQVREYVATKHGKVLQPHVSSLVSH
jgi:DNA-binding transcriptional LysR family regulator